MVFVTLNYPVCAGVHSSLYQIYCAQDGHKLFLQEAPETLICKGNGIKNMAENKRKGKIVIDRERCKGCHICMETCPNNRIEVDDALNKKGYSPARFKEKVSEGEKGCVGCAQCATVCPDVAIEVYRAK